MLIGLKLMKNKINIGVLGLGRLFKKRLINLFQNELKQINLKTIYDIDKKKNLYYSKKFNLSINKSFREFLKKKLDYVYIATESGNHFKHARLALKFGHNIILEKPPVLKIEDLHMLLKLEKKFKKKIYVVFQNRLNSSVLFFKKKISSLIAKKKILNVNLTLLWSRDKNYYSDWHGKWKMDGGVLSQQGIHYIDLLCCFFGKPIRTIAVSDNKKNFIECEDTMVSLVEFENKIFIQVFLTTALEKNDHEASIVITTNKKQYKLGGLCCNEYFERDILNNKKFLKNLNYSKTVPDGYGTSHHDILKNILKNNKKKIIKLKDTINTVKLMNMMYSSIEKNRWVTFKEKKLKNRLGR